MRPIWLPVLCLTLLLTACANTTQVITRTTTATPQGAAHKLLLVAKTPENGLRETWELTCRPIFERRGLQVALSHQEVPLWQKKGRSALLQWARQHHANRILIVNLTQLLLRPPQMPPRHDLNPMSQPDEGQPTIRIGLGGNYQKPAEPPVKPSFPADLLEASGDSLWHGVARTHAANDITAIARSQCTALRDTFVHKGLLP